MELFTSAVEIVKHEQQLSLLSVLCEPVQHDGTRRTVQFTARDGSEMRVSFEVTHETRPILSVKMGADTGAMTIFQPDGEANIIRDDSSNPDSYETSGGNNLFVVLGLQGALSLKAPSSLPLLIFGCA